MFGQYWVVTPPWWPQAQDLLSSKHIILLVLPRGNRERTRICRLLSIEMCKEITIVVLIPDLNKLEV